MTIFEAKQKIQEESKKEGAYINAIAEYIDKELLTCQQNADKIGKKSLSGAYEYVKSQAHKTAHSGIAIIIEFEVYGWIREYYEISDLTVVKPEQKKNDGPINLLDFL